MNVMIGYAKEDVNSDAIFRKVMSVKNIIKEILQEQEFINILVAGCGNGDEAKVLQKVFNTYVTGVDISLPDLNFMKGDRLNLLKADLGHLPFKDKSFSFIYCYHVLEHVNDPLLVLQELKRVLTNNGVIFIGFPNRLRITPSYLKSNLKKGFFKIIQNNAKDYYYKITGRFKNEYGAHAGFSEKEFLKLATPLFEEVIPIRSKWIEYNYNKYSWIFKFTKKFKFDNMLYPSNYYLLRL